MPASPPASPLVAAASRPAVSPAVVALALALLLGLQPVTTDLYLPALPRLTRDFGATLAQSQLTMSALILAFGIGQLFWGPVADRFGRRPVLLLSLALYTAASVASALAPAIGWLVLWRTLQGAALAAAVVCARAMVRDFYEPTEGAHVMSKGMSGLGLIAIASPVLGGTLAATLGWRAPLGAVAAIGAVALAFVALRLPESLAPRNRQALRLGPLAGAVREVLGHRTFRAWSALVACTYGGLFAILALSSFVYIEVLGLAPGQFGIALASASVAYLLGTFQCRRWLLRHGLDGAVRRGAAFSLAGGLSMAALALAGVQEVWAVLLPQWLYAFGHGIHQPCGQAGAVGPFPRNAGVAAALNGFMLAATAFLVGLWVGQAMDGSTRPMGLVVGVFGIATATVGWTLVQRHGVPARVRTA
ncbi:multidrug effflux MFS transporter [Azohydromonas caseinilytica]|uniref:Bcr/CflA family efflux transporter n=1 Tax=Azohydromonas caseinilytica TaxID=2728836 RepID=A0A848F9N2_9BURK|nr:multidrug effflux MFS transporter [Azohydromonas caseinilytica]NML15546.1 multidrug effflux MFS transporter [Azohydromonas caseinilytica]